MQGNLSSFCLAEIFRTIYNERYSGELVLQHKTEQKHIYFERGQVVFAASNKPEDRIGETLVRYRKLTREQIEEFVAQLPAGQRLGRALVEIGILNERELITYVTLQIIDIIYSLFNWSEGSYTFVEGEDRAPEELKMRFSTATLILEGIRRIDDFDILRRGIGDPARPLLPTAAGRAKLQAIAFSPLELSIINMVKEQTDLLKVIVSCKEKPEKVLQAIYGLLAIGILQQGEERLTGAVQTSPSAYEVTPALAAIGIDNQLLTELQELKQRIETRDARVILNVTPDNNANQIYDAYLRLATRFHPDKFVNAPAQLKSDAEYVFAAINESYNVMRANIMPASPPIPQIGVAPPPSTYGTPSTNYSPYTAPPTTPPANTGMRGAASSPYSTPPPPSSYYNPPSTTTPANLMPQYQSGLKRSPITRAVSDEMDYNKRDQAQSLAQRRTVDIERALHEMLDYFDDRRAPLFVAEALSTLLRTRPPFHVGRREVVETIITWARNKSSTQGWPIPQVLLRVLSLIKQAEQSQLIEGFDAAVFYPAFIQELAGYCTPPEADEFKRAAASL
ncbi:MAG: DUF4388 domain-containing protein [Acidobacteriota bacterium]